MHFKFRGVKLCLLQILDEWRQSPLQAIRTPNFSFPSQFTSHTHCLFVYPSVFSLSTFLLSQGRTKVYVGLSFCPTVRDGCSVLWVTESSCVVDSVFVCVSAGVNMCRNVGVCVCVFMAVCCSALQVSGAC